MSIPLLMDVHVHAAISEALMDRGVDVLTAQADGSAELDDSELLDRATAMGRILFTQDADFLREAAQRQQSGAEFAGVIYGHQRRVAIAQAIDDLELIATVYSPEDLQNRVEYLPL